MRIQSAFEQAGILFLDDDAGGAAGEEAPARLVLALHRKPNPRSRRSQPSSRSYPYAAPDISCFHDLASQAGIDIVTVRQIEACIIKPRRVTLIALRQALERASVEFIDENGGGPGVRLRKRQRKKPK